MTDTTNIRDAIKGLPEGSLLSASFDERYQVVGTTDDLKALVAENEVLKEQADKAKKIADAWLIEGIAPQHHRYWQAKLSKEWPVLARAIKAFTVTTHGGNDD